MADQGGIMISLYGSLARRFEKKFGHSAKNISIPVRSGSEMMRAMEANFKGFRTLVKRSGLYRVTRGAALTCGRNIGADEIDVRFSEEDWHIIPAAAGCKSGWGQVLLGAVLIGASFFVPIGGSVLFGMGVSMSLGGIAQELSPNPGVSDYGERENPEERPSYLAGGPVNSVEPGLTLPVAYGDCWCGSITVSGGMKVEDI